MQGKRLIRQMRLQGLLSFGPQGESVDLEPLNVLVGLNSSGKSNFIEALGLLAAAPTDLGMPIRRGGGITEWLWKGHGADDIAEMDAAIFYPDGHMPLRYFLSLTRSGQRVELVDEAIENERPIGLEQDVYFFYRYQKGHPVFNVRTEESGEPGTETGRLKRYLRREDLSPELSVLSQRRDPYQYPEITYLANQLGAITLHTEWNLGRFTAPRIPQGTDLPEDYLLPDASNLGLVLNDLQHRPGVMPVILENLRKLHEGINNVTVKLHGGSVQLYLHEEDLPHGPVPATRLSDGTLRYLSLLSILCHPDPPPLICIEEPELGLHPDILPTIAELLIDASQRTQLVVTTHSDILVSGLTDVPECVLICERDQNGTHFYREDPNALKQWLEKYTLGEAWRMGAIGGNR